MELDFARKTGNSPDALLLVAARNRPAMIAAFDSYLADPKTGLREWDIRLRALFTFLDKEAPLPLPPSGWQVPEPAELERLQGVAQARSKHYEALLRQEAARLISIVQTKDGSARKTSAEAIAAIIPDAAKAAGLVPPDDYGLSREELLSRFTAFPATQQEEILNKKWDLVRGPEMIPVLLKLLAKAQPLPLTAFGVWGTAEGLTDSALERSYELSPEQTARLLRADIASGNPRYASFAVRQLPSQSIPEADESLRALIKSNLNAVLPLVARFGTAKLADDMRKEYGAKRHWPCAEEESFVAYFVRVFPAEAGEGRAMLRRAMADRKDRGCYRWLLSRVAAVAWNAAIEKQSITALADADPEAAGNAAQVLAEFGGASVEPLLWNQLENWSEQWRGRAAELEPHPITGALPNTESRSGEGLFTAISSAHAWRLDEQRRQRLVALCIDDECRRRWSAEGKPAIVRIDVSSGGSRYPAAFRLDDYTERTLDQLKRKLQQYPAGTVFRWCPQSFNPFDAFTPGQREEMYSDVAAFLTQRAMTIEPYTPASCDPGSVVK